jgi:hypothetical protein
MYYLYMFVRCSCIHLYMFVRCSCIPSRFRISCLLRTSVFFFLCFLFFHWDLMSFLWFWGSERGRDQQEISWLQLHVLTLFEVGIRFSLTGVRWLFLAVYSGYISHHSLFIELGSQWMDVLNLDQHGQSFFLMEPQFQHRVTSFWVIDSEWLGDVSISTCNDAGAHSRSPSSCVARSGAHSSNNLQTSMSTHLHCADVLATIAEHLLPLNSKLFSGHCRRCGIGRNPAWQWTT